MKYYVFSESYPLEKDSLDEPIHIIYQYFIPTNKLRQHEILTTLQKNVENEHVSQVHLLNERIYSEKELGISSKKIKQHNINKRLCYNDVFQYVRTKKLNGFVICMNADIFFSNLSIENIKRTRLKERREMLALLRYEYNPSRPNQSQLFGPRFDSQDSWIFHSNMLFEEKFDRAFSFPFGKPGCDNKLIYLFHCLGYKLYNDPLQFVSYHVHSSKLRSYTLRDTIPPPWGFLVPSNIPIQNIVPALGISLPALFSLTQKFTQIQFQDNIPLQTYISGKIEKGQHFIIPRISGIENNVAVYYHLITKKGAHHQLTQGIQRLLKPMKNNAGIMLSGEDNIQRYSERYLKAFEYCECFGAWEPQGEYIKHISHSHEFMMQKYGSSKQPFWALTFDIFHYIFQQPWTHGLANQRILLVSPFIESMKSMIDKRTHIYGVDLFPNCEFCYLKPPQTHASMPSRCFMEELENFEGKIDDLLDSFDVALLSCGGYANPIGAYIYEQGKSAIYVGGVLQMYFGILGSRWEKERPDALRLFHNEHWTRPKENEKPANSHLIEGGCYW
jgi:hypothetical protein